MQLIEWAGDPWYAASMLAFGLVFLPLFWGVSKWMFATSNEGDNEA